MNDVLDGIFKPAKSSISAGTDTRGSSSSNISTKQKEASPPMEPPRNQAKLTIKTQSSMFGSNNDLPKETEIAEIESVIGYIEEEHGCVHNNFTGTLFAGPLALYFLGRIFFFEWKVVIRWVDVLQVEKSNVGVSIMARREDNTQKVYEFGINHNINRVWKSLVTLQNDALTDHPFDAHKAHAGVRSPTNGFRQIRRMNSDPSHLSHLAIAMSPSDVNTNASHQNQGIGSRTGTGSDGTAINYGGVPGMQSQPSSLASSSSSKSGSNPAQGGTMSKGGIADMQQLWNSLTQNETEYSETAVKDFTIKCDMNTFAKMFIEDSAPHSIASYMEEKGDDGIQQSDWVVMEDEAANGHNQSRTIEYTHPVNAPMAPPMARARKEQVYRKVGTYGLLLETKTFVADVPLTDCFYVADRIRVQPAPGKTSAVLVTMEYDIRFVKSTMFKSIIARTTRSEFEKFMKEYSEFCARCLGDDRMSEPSHHRRNSLHVIQSQQQQQAAEMGTNAQKMPGSAGFIVMGIIIIVGFGAMLAIQYMLLKEMKNMKMELEGLRTEVAESQICAQWISNSMSGSVAETLADASTAEQL